MENRSFDHLLGWLPRADGKQAGLRYADRNGREHSTYRLAPDYQGCRHPDPDHTSAAGRIQYNGGKCDGFLRSPYSDRYAIGYYTQADLPFLGVIRRAIGRFVTATSRRSWLDHIRTASTSTQVSPTDSSTRMRRSPFRLSRTVSHSGLSRRSYHSSGESFLTDWATSTTRSSAHMTVSLPIARLDACPTSHSSIPASRQPSGHFGGLPPRSATFAQASTS